MQDFDVHKQRADARRKALQTRIGRAEDRRPALTDAPRPSSPQTEARLRSIFRSAPIGIGLVANRVLLEVNDRLCAMVGYTPDELVGRNARMLYLSDEDYDYVGHEKYHQIAERGTGTVETRWRRKDGEVIDVLLSSTPLDLNDLSQGVTFTALDITARKKAEDELQSIFDMSLDMVCIADINTTHFIKVNPAFEQTLGYGEDELVGTSFLDLIHPDDHAATKAIVQTKLLKGESVINFENRYRCKDGTYRWLNWTSQPRPERGLTYSIARDITERRKADVALRESEAILNETGLIARIGGWKHDLITGQATWTQALYDIIEIDAGPPPGVDEHLSYYPPAQRRILEEAYRRAVETGEPFDLELEVTTAKGHPLWCRVIGRPVMRAGRCVEMRGTFQDINDRKQAERALVQGAEKYRRMEANIPGVVYEFAMRPDGTYYYPYVSPEVRDLFGLEPEAVMQDPRCLLDLLHSDDAARHQSSILESAEGLTPWREELRGVVNGQVRWYDCMSRPERLADGTIRWDGIILETTDRKQAEEALRDSEQRYRAIVEDQTEFIGRFDPNGRVTFVNQALCRFYGVSRDDLIGKDFAAWMSQEAHSDLWQRLAALTPEHPIETHENEGILADGRKFWGRWSNRAIFDETGTVIEFQAVGRDVTSRKEAEEALRQERDRAQKYLDTAGTVFLVLDAEGRVNLVNKKGCEVLEYAEEEIVGQPWFDTFLPAEVRQDIRDVFGRLMGGELAQAEYVESLVLTRSGRQRTIAWHNAMLRDETGAIVGTLSSGEDVTERKRAEAERARLTTIIEATSDLVAMSAADGQITYLNQAGRQMLGGSEAETEPPQSIAAAHPNWAYRLVAEQGIPEAIRGGVWSGETAVLGQDGREIPVSQVIMSHKSKDGTLEYLSTIMRDLTERQAAEAALRESEMRFRELAEMLPQTVFEIDADGTFTFGNHAGREMFGYSIQELSEMNVAQLFVPEDRERIARSIRHRLNNQAADNRQYQALRKDGSTFPMLIYASPVIRDGEAIGLRGIGLDITERQRAERAIREGKAKLESILESSPNAITVIDLAGGVVDCNQATVEMHGLEARYELLGRSLFDLVAERDRALARMHLDQTLAHGPTRDVELTLLKRDGREFPAEVSISVMSNRDESAMGFVVATADIHERKQAREALRRSEEKYRSLIANIPDVVWTSDEHGNTTFMSPNIEYVCGYHPEDICGQPGDPWFEKIHPEDQEKARQAEKKLFREGTPLDIEYRFKTKDGRWIWLQDRSTGTYEKDGVLHTDGVFVDISERKQAEEALVQSTHRLLESQKVAQLGHYSFDVVADLWASSDILDAIFGLPEDFAKTSAAWLEIVHPEQREELRAYLGDVISGQRPGFDKEYRIVRLSDQQARWVHGLGRIERNEAGEAVRMIGTIQDITERREAEQALQESERRLSTLMANLPGMAYRRRDDEQWTMEFVSEGCTELTGYATIDVAGNRSLSYNDIIHPDDRQRVHDVVAAGLKANSAFEIEYRIITSEGREKWVWERGRRVGRADDGTGILEGFVLDVSERQKAEERLRAHQKKLKSLASELALAEERERRRIAADLHDHACQNLVLSNMKLQELRTSAPEVQLQAIEAISHTLNKTIESVRDLTFDLSSPTLYKFGLSAALEELLEDKLSAEYDIRCRFSDDGQPKPLSQDVLVLLFQSVRELLINVIKHAHAHEVALDIRREQDSIRIVLTDDGIGFDVNDVLSYPSQQRSVGLFNILERLDYIGGMLDIESQPGHGSRFVLVASLTTELPGAKESHDGSANSTG